MTSGADLFVVCKQCGSEVSPYITECPGNRLRRRAPKLPRAHAPSRTARGRRLGPMLSRRSRGSRSPSAAVEGYGPDYGSDRWALTRPYATIALVAAAAALWVATRAEPLLYSKLLLHAEFVLRPPNVVVLDPLEGHWWRLLSTQFVYASGWYAFTTLIVVAIFGWLVERRHGPVVVVAIFLGLGTLGVLAATALYSFPVVGGGNAGALALLAVWASPDLRAARSDGYYEGDLIGAGVIAALLLAMPFAVHEASWLAGVIGGVLGLLMGLGLSRASAPEL